MTGRTALFLVGAAAAVLLSATLVSLGRGRPAPETVAASTALSSATAGPVTLALRGGATRAYQWSMSVIVSPTSSGATLSADTSISGTLNVRVIAGGGHSTLAVQITSLHVRIWGQPNARMEEVFSTPFLVEIEPNGRLGATRFPFRLAPADRTALDAAIRSLEMVLPREPAARWEVTQGDQNGDYLASYEVEARSGDILKRKLGYAPRHDSPFSAVVEASSARVRIDPEGSWLLRAEGAERLILGTSGGHVLARVHAQFRLEPLPAPPRSDLTIWHDETLKTFRTTVFDPSGDAPSAWEEEQRARVRAQLRRDRVTLKGLFGALAGGPGDAAISIRIADYLRAFPNEARTVPAKLPALRSPEAAQVLGALGTAGTPQAQSALLDVVENEAQLRENRLRALFALAGVERPTLEAVERLASTAGPPGGRAETREVASTALLVLGTLAEKAPDELRSRVSRQLEDRLSAATAPGDQRLLLLALGNARAALVPDTLRAYLRSRYAVVREAAAAVAANGTDAGVADELIGLLGRDKDATVRGAVMEGLLRRPADARANEAIARALAEGREPEARVRAQMVGYLVRQMKEFPGNRQLLEAHLKRETDREVAVAILNSLVR